MSEPRRLNDWLDRYEESLESGEPIDCAAEALRLDLAFARDSLDRQRKADDAILGEHASETR